MQKRVVISLIRWIRRMEMMSYSSPAITLESLFKAAYANYYESVAVNTKFVLNCDIEDFRHSGRVPTYVVFFIRKVVYPNLVKGGGNGTMPCV